jgi:hypothetical protein
VVIAGQVVLGEQIDDEARARRIAVALLLGRPVLAAEEGEVAPLVPGHVVVRVPRLVHREVALKLGSHDRLEVDEQPDVG